MKTVSLLKSVITCLNNIRINSKIFSRIILLQMNPKDPDTLIQRGACLVELQRFEPALEDMENVFELLSLRKGIVDCSHLKSRYLKLLTR